MSSLVTTLLNYVCSPVVRRVQRSAGVLTAPSDELLLGVVLLADITGFTTLTEQLAQRGPAGAEEIGQVLNTYFTQFIDRISTYGGEVIKFAGDAVLAVWEVQDGRLAEAALAAVQCAWEIQTQLRATANTNLRLNLRIGLSAGDIRILHLGGTLGRWEFLPAGEPLRAVSRAVHQAQPGEVVLAPGLHALLAEQVQVNEHKALRAPVAVAPPIPPAPPPPTLTEDQTNALRAYIPSAVVGRLAAGQTDWVAELRRVTVVFVELTDLEETVSLERSQAITLAIQQAIYRYEGNLNKINVDDKGVTVLVAYGLPPLSHEDDPVRSVLAALAIHAALARLNVACHIGVTTGRVFCGSVGAPYRREYTLLGDTVNLAARLMQRAAHLDSGLTIMVDAATWETARQRVEFDTFAPLTFKGRAEPVPVYQPRSEKRQTRRAAQALIGRRSEQAALNAGLEVVRTGQPAPRILLEGEPGMGKSRLMEFLLQAAEPAGVKVFLGMGDAVEKTTPYHAWRGVLAQLVGLPPLVMGDEYRRNYTEWLARRPDLAEVAPLLNPLLPFNLPDTATTAQMTGSVRANNTQMLLSQLVQESVAAGPTALVIDDAHWLDSASWAVLNVATELAALLVVVITRPVADPASDDYARFRATPRLQHLLLKPFDSADTMAIVCHRLGVRQLPREVSALIHSKAEGNPFFSEELAFALRDSGVLLLRDGECRVAPGVDLATVPLPDTARGVVISRIDRLTAAEQLTLKVASVIGRIFSQQVLRSIHPIPGDRPLIELYLSTLEKLDLTLLDTPEPDLTYFFKHIITHEAAYNLMLFAQRSQLHQAVAEWYEQTYADQLAPYYAVLAHHWGKTENKAKQAEYLEKAGEQALRNGASREAIRFFTEVLALDVSNANRKARWERLLGEAYLNSGLVPESVPHFYAALEGLGEKPSRTEPEMQRALLREALRQMWHRLRPARYRLEAGKAVDERKLELARIYGRLAHVHFFNNAAIPLVQTNLSELNHAEAAGTLSAELVRAYSSTIVILGQTPLRGWAKNYREAVFTLLGQLEDVSVKAWALLALAADFVGQADWPKAEQSARDSETLSRSIGDWRQVGQAITVRTASVYHRGAFQEAYELYDQIRALGQRNDDLQFQLWACHGQSILYYRWGRYAEMHASLLAGWPFLQRVDETASVIMHHALLGAAHWHLGDRAAALTEAQKGLALVANTTPSIFSIREGYSAIAEVWCRLWEVEGAQHRASALQACKAMEKFANAFPNAAPRAALWRGYAQKLAGQSAAARRTWLKALPMAEATAQPFEAALLWAELGRLGDTEAAQRAQTIATELRAVVV